MLGFQPISSAPLSSVSDSITQAVGASAGTSLAAALGRGLVISVGQSAGLTTATAVGSVSWAAIGASVGLATTTAAGSVSWAAIGASAGAAAGAATGVLTAAATGLSSGVSIVSGYTVGTFSVVGTSHGLATADFQAAARFSAAGTSSGSSAAGARNSSWTEATASSDGISSVNASARAMAVTTGQAAGTAEVLSFGTAFSLARASSDSFSSASAYALDAAIPASPQPWFPSFARVLMPEAALDGMIRHLGVRLGWMRSHQCGCTLGADIPGSPNPNCNTCHGRGVYWENWTQPFTGLITYMHTSSAPDEPGAAMDQFTGQAQAADPTLTIPFKGPGIEAHIWRNASEFDAYVELDALTRFTSALMVGDTSILPYQQQLDVQGVYVYDPVAQRTYPLSPNQYFVTGSSVTLDPSFPAGTGYTVEYMAAPVYIAFRRAGGLPHVRPFGAGTGQIPRRFRIVALDIWSRARKDGFGGLSVTPQALQ